MYRLKVRPVLKGLMRLVPHPHGRWMSTQGPIPGDHMVGGLGLPSSASSLTLPGPFRLEYGDVLPSVTLGYNTYGTLAPDGRNAVIVGHSLTSNSAVHEWWGALLGPGPQYMLDTDRYFVVCVNYLGSVYGSSGPLSANGKGGGGGQPYSADFPVATVKDNVGVQRALLEALGVKGVALAMGGSLGGMLALEWAATFPGWVEALCIVGSCGRHPDWAIGFGEAGRQAVYADPLWEEGYYAARGGKPPLKGMAVARQLAMLSYRTPQSLTSKFQRGVVEGGRAKERRLAQGQGAGRVEDPATLTPPPFYQVEGYLNYQGEKFVGRFDPLAYVRLTQLLDSHDLGRGRTGDYKDTLATIQQPCLVVGIDSDLLYPYELSLEMNRLIKNSHLHCISSPHGHDSFLIEIKALNEACVAWRDKALGFNGNLLSLLRLSKWEGEGTLWKHFEFRDARAAQTFVARLKDLIQLKIKRDVPMVPKEGSGGVAGWTVRVRGGGEGGGGSTQRPSEEDLQVALWIDDIAADLQLQGGKNWS